MQVSGRFDRAIQHDVEREYPVPKREGVFDRNIKKGI